MDSIARYAQDCTLGEEFARNVQAALGNDTREAHGNGGMQSKGLVDDGFEIWKSLDHFRRRDRVVLASEGLIEFSLEFRLDIGVRGEVIGDGAGGAGMSFQRVVGVIRYRGEEAYLEVLSEPAIS